MPGRENLSNDMRDSPVFLLLSIRINVKRWARASHAHAVGFEHPLQSVFLFSGVAFLNRLLRRRQVFEFCERLKELLDFAGRLVGIDDLGWDAPPRVLYVAGNEHGVASSEAEPILANLQLHLP